MNTAVAILAHALRMIVFDIPTTLRVILPALMLVVGAAIVAQLVTPELLALQEVSPEALQTLAPNTLLTAFALLIVALVGYALLAILWHRHVLMDGPARETALRPGTGIVLGYMWRAIVLGFVQLLVGIPLGIAIAVLGGVSTALTGGVPNILAFSIIGIAASIVFLWIALRLSVVLPAAALGETMRITESWTITAPLARDLLALAVMLAAVNALISTFAALLGGAVPAADLLFKVTSYIVEGLVIISILTTLYGHLVQRRPLG